MRSSCAASNQQNHTAPRRINLPEIDTRTRGFPPIAYAAAASLSVTQHSAARLKSEMPFTHNTLPYIKNLTLLAKVERRERVTGWTSERRSLGERTVEEILPTAEELDGMAATAVTPGGKQALTRLATRFRIFAARRATAREPNGPAIRPGGTGPSPGLYELRDVFGTWEGDVVKVRQGELLPRAPHELTWHPTTEAAECCGRRGIVLQPLPARRRFVELPTECLRA
jgi:hypothetical protein